MGSKEDIGSRNLEKNVTLLREVELTLSCLTASHRSGMTLLRWSPGRRKLLAGVETPVPTEYEAGWTPEGVCKLRIRNKPLNPTGKLTAISCGQPVA